LLLAADKESSKQEMLPRQGLVFSVFLIVYLPQDRRRHKNINNEKSTYDNFSSYSDGKRMHNIRICVTNTRDNELIYPNYLTMPDRDITMSKISKRLSSTITISLKFDVLELKSPTSAIIFHHTVY
jgi:hypothetical protein